ncbi:hypothetical protein OGAPHI_005357 [Ogataea philodendri]|uniref:DASH complex subunit DUO1 n=1 Tax=Ogataea philodendri TaxID=1378263 RepID=A0A9P8P1C4_9ASCO|nr:uncharacterized protein OGAPHI_005357 [Ogataea philodendri]KAH3663367.1 hypothetical protein OGAPHI_005357 [Ogataea philodendri]
MSQQLTPALNSLEQVMSSPGPAREKDRDAAIRTELDKLAKINAAFEQSSISIRESTNYIRRIKESTVKANELIQIWGKILSQNKHTAQLLSDPENTWNGASHQDEKVADKLAQYEELLQRYEHLVAERKNDDKRRRRKSPASTLSFSLTVTSEIFPETGELITISIFMALKTHTGSPFLTSPPLCTRTSITTPAIGAPTSFGL